MSPFFAGSFQPFWFDLIWLSFLNRVRFLRDNNDNRDDDDNDDDEDDDDKPQ